ncbi:MAG: ATP-dependent DNA ligase [Mesorhizobium sp.]|uniref:ATP-dependent DNA ligase n=1 Tax=Mesorhizobium sp. TaxID=1871066 RepID=UPI000FE9371F|nr:RNA ligase family protein [Mesorhizobium sp.]RWP88378.1 MAG: ATP-dependent DNA ligase [Mesorhizobium sp.]
MRLKFIPPMQPELVDTPPEGEDWIHEIKFDGYRTQIIKDEDGIRLLTRRGYNWTARYKVLADQAAAIEADDFIIEGEAIVVDEAGRSDFHALQSAVSSRETYQDYYLVAFDLLHLNGHDLRSMPLEDRRDILQGRIEAGGRIQFSEAMPGTGDAVYYLADQTGQEGIVSKRRDSLYRSGPTMNWRKIKCYDYKEMDIIGIQRDPGQAARVLMADGGRYVGTANINFKFDKRKRLWDRVQGKVGGPVPKGLKKDKAEWLKPGLVGHVKFLKGEEMLRHAKLLDYREQE